MNAKEAKASTKENDENHAKKANVATKSSDSKNKLAKDARKANNA